MRLFPQTRRGTWLLAAAVWVGACLVAWTMLPFQPRYEWLMPRGQVVGFGPKSDVLVTVDVSMNCLIPNGAVRVVDVATGSERAVLMPSDTYVTWTDMSHNGHWLVVGHSSKALAPDRFSLINMDDRSVSELPAVGVTSGGPQTHFSADGRYLAFSASDQPPRIGVFDLANRRELVTVPGSNPFAIAADGRTLAAWTPGSGGATAVIGIWDVPEGRRRSFVPAPPRWPKALLLSPNGAALTVTAESDADGNRPRTQVWRTTDGSELPVEVGPVMHHVGWDDRLWAHSPDGKGFRLVLSDISAAGVRTRWVAPGDMYDGRVSPNGRTVQVSEQYEPPAAPIQWLVSRRYLSEEDWGGLKIRHWRLFDLSANREMARIPGQPRGIDWSPDGLLLATGDFENFHGPESHVHVWDIPPRKPLSWLALTAAVLALPIAGLAWRRTLRLRREVA